METDTSDSDSWEDVTSNSSIDSEFLGIEPYKFEPKAKAATGKNKITAKKNAVTCTTITMHPSPAQNWCVHGSTVLGISEAC